MVQFYKNGPGCNENRIGEFVNESFIGDKDWKCVNGCDQPIVKVGPAEFYFMKINYKFICFDVQYHTLY
jgi:hypothetical protein